MSVSSERIDFTLEQAARTAGLAPAGEPPSLITAAEADDAVWLAWAGAPRPELGGAAPAAYAESLAMPALLRYLDGSARHRRGAVARLWAEELARRLTLEARAAGGGPVAAALAERVLAEPEDEWRPPYAALGALDVLGRWGHPAAVQTLLLGLASDLDDVRAAAARGLGRVGLPALAEVEQALARSQDPELRLALLLTLAQMPRSPEATGALRRAWSAGSAADRLALVEAMGRYGDPELRPLILEEMARPRDRYHWAVARVALQRLGGDAGAPPPPPPGPPGAEAEDLVQAAAQLAAGGLDDLAGAWMTEGLERLGAQEQSDPGGLDWLLWERAHALADRVLQRSPEGAIHRFLDYCAGALYYYGALSVEHLVGAVTVAGAVAPGSTDAVWAALRTDRRFRVHTGRLVALPSIDNLDELLRRREAAGLPPAILPLGSLALAARGLPHLAWTGAEAEAADQLARFLPPELGTPERITELQAALRATGLYADAFRRWVQRTLDQGIEFDKRLRTALVGLWEQTARWELFGHTPAAAQEWLEMQEGE